jgi:hypothetical protein
LHVIMILGQRALWWYVSFCSVLFKLSWDVKFCVNLEKHVWQIP